MFYVKFNLCLHVCFMVFYLYSRFLAHCKTIRNLLVHSSPSLSHKSSPNLLSLLGDIIPDSRHVHIVDFCPRFESFLCMILVRVMSKTLPF